MRFLVNECMIGNIGDVVCTDERDQTVLAGGEDLVHLADGIHKTWLRKVFFVAGRDRMLAV